jgi:hypothetical protein
MQYREMIKNVDVIREGDEYNQDGTWVKFKLSIGEVLSEIADSRRPLPDLASLPVGKVVWHEPVMVKSGGNIFEAAYVTSGGEIFGLNADKHSRSCYNYQAMHYNAMPEESEQPKTKMVDLTDLEIIEALKQYGCVLKHTLGALHGSWTSTMQKPNYKICYNHFADPQVWQELKKDVPV